MRSGTDTFRALQAAARSTAAKTGEPAPTQEYLIRHLLESFLDRLTRTEHADDFVLKGGILLAAYGVRRPTKDVDANAVSADVTAAHLADVVRDIATVQAGDGVVFNLDSITVQEIREQSAYPGLRIRVKASIGSWEGTAAWDISTGDPIVPAPRSVTINRLLGAPIVLLGYAAETTIAEKGVTILERGITSTRWRDYVDIVQLCRQGFDADELLRSARAVAHHRGIALGPVSPHLTGYGEVGQAKWAAWRRKERLEPVALPDLDDQVALISSYLDPVFETSDYRR
ncbi:MAG: nucleotidyl transferase AbiEii/AbiGii toxin family protein [Actinomycetia bacterium]|nr:nucleotidyl transferase AbiEii/AbiGii toxin family protein [Actinomycetes bacterium]